MVVVRIILQDEFARPYPRGWRLQVMTEQSPNYERGTQGGMVELTSFDADNTMLMSKVVNRSISEGGTVSVRLWRPGSTEIYDSGPMEYVLHGPDRNRGRTEPLLNLFIKRQVIPGPITVTTVGINPRADSRATTWFGEIFDRLSTSLNLGPSQSYTVRDRLRLIVN